MTDIRPFSHVLVFLTNRVHRIFSAGIFMLVIITAAYSQDRVLVWSDEFDGTTPNRSFWSFETGTQGCLHYSTDRPENTQVTGGELHLIALEESYQGYDYTASIIKTTRAVYWKYGLIEARIKLPATTGFCPSFWLLAENNIYGWWPESGEIDIMEHPTNQPDQIFGTVHTGKYNYFTGTSPVGDHTTVPDAESAFHTYGIEWTPEKIDFYVDDVKYFTFENEHSGYMAWPFDQPFYILLGMGVGGDWAGPPDETTVFPGIMQVDYVRVYQYVDEISVCGSDYVLPGSAAVQYNAPLLDDAEYSWSVTGGASVSSGQGTHRIAVDWDDLSGEVQLTMTTAQGNTTIEYPVETVSSLVKNTGFETGTKYWKKVAWPAVADFELTTSDVHTGDNALYVHVTTPGTNPWDAQLSQGELSLRAGNSYTVSLWAKSTTNSSVNVGVINSSDYTLYGSNICELTNTWTHYEYNFTSPANVTASLNIDMGDHTGEFFFDDVMLIPPENYTANDEKRLEYLDAVSIYPNPTDGIINIEAPEEGHYAIQLFDMPGKCMLSRSLREGHSVDISQFPPGVYYLKIESDNQFVIMEVLKK
jgi:beta-glucanase (GH16 family)